MNINLQKVFGIIALFLSQASLEVIAAVPQGPPRTSLQMLDAAEGQRGRRDRAREGSQQQPSQFFPTVGSQQELDDYRVLDAETSPLNRLTLAETFLTTYPESELKHLIYRIRIQTYSRINNSQAQILAAGDALEAHTAFYEMKMVQAAEEETQDVPEYARFQLDFANAKSYYLRAQMDGYNKLSQFEGVADVGVLALNAENEAWAMYDASADKNLPEYESTLNQHSQFIMLAYQQMVNAQQSTGNVEGIIKYSEEALELDPNSLPFLLTLSDTLASRPAEDRDEREEQQKRAEEMAKRAMDFVERLLGSPAAVQMSQAQKSGLASAVHSTLGRIYFNQSEWGDARDEYDEALEAAPRDSNSYFFLGLCFVRENKGNDALEALAKSVFLEGPEEQQARETLQDIWDTLKKKGDIEAFIQEQGKSIGR